MPFNRFGPKAANHPLSGPLAALAVKQLLLWVSLVVVALVTVVAVGVVVGFFIASSPVGGVLGWLLR